MAGAARISCSWKPPSGRKMPLLGLSGGILFGQFFLYFRFSADHLRSSEEEAILDPKAGYGMVSAFYEPGNEMMRADRKRFDALLDELKPQGAVLDFGCGTGYYTRILSEHCDKVLAFDQSPEMLEVFQAGGVPSNVECPGPVTVAKLWS